jgi:hypothetical protein
MKRIIVLFVTLSLFVVGCIKTDSSSSELLDGIDIHFLGDSLSANVVGLTGMAIVGENLVLLPFSTPYSKKHLEAVENANRDNQKLSSEEFSGKVGWNPALCIDILGDTVWTTDFGTLSPRTILALDDKNVLVILTDSSKTEAWFWTLSAIDGSVLTRQHLKWNPLFCPKSMFMINEDEVLVHSIPWKRNQTTPNNVFEVYDVQGTFKYKWPLETADWLYPLSQGFLAVIETDVSSLIARDLIFLNNEGKTLWSIERVDTTFQFRVTGVIETDQENRDILVSGRERGRGKFPNNMRISADGQILGISELKSIRRFRSYQPVPWGDGRWLVPACKREKTTFDNEEIPAVWDALQTYLIDASGNVLEVDDRKDFWMIPQLGGHTTVSGGVWLVGIGGRERRHNGFDNCDIAVAYLKRPL